MQLIASSTVALALSLLAPGISNAAPQVAPGEHVYTINALPSVDRFAFTTPSGLNERGDVAGLLAGGSRYTQAARWDGTTWRTLGDGEASGINRAGQVVGFLEVDTHLGPVQHATTWDASGVPHDLGTLSNGAWSQAVAINDRGQVAGYAQAGTLAHAFIWREGQGMQDLGSLGSGSSYAFAVDPRGNVAGSSDGQAVLWDGDRHIRILGAGSSSIGYGMNKKGMVVGGAGDHAFVWRAQRGVATLGTMAGASSSTAVAINDRDQIVGSALVADSSGMPAFRAVVWQHQGMTDLNSLIDSASGWQLNSATAINDRGQIVGSGIYQGQSRAYLLTPRAGGLD